MSVSSSRQKSPSLSDYLDVNSKTFFIQKNKNILHDYEQFLKVKEERKNGILFSSIKKLSYEERKKNETYNYYNKSPFKDDPRLIITNYKILKENDIGENNTIKNKILGVDEGFIKLPKLNKENNYIDLFHGLKLSNKNNTFDSPNKTNENIISNRLMTLNNDSIINKHKSILSSIKRKNRINPMFLDRGQEFFSHLSKLEKNNKLNDAKSNKNNPNEKNSMELMQHKYLEKLGKQKEKYENELNYNYEIKCLDNWDFEHITKSKDIKTDNEFKQFLDEVDNSQMKWLVEIKNDKEQLQLMRRNKHLYDLLTQIDREQQAIIMQSMTVNKKGFNFEIFDNNKTMDNNIDINSNLEIKNNTNNQNDIAILNNEVSSNNKNNVSQVEYYRQIMKEKIKVEEMFHTELKTVAEDCYLTN